MISASERSGAGQGCRNAQRGFTLVELLLVLLILAVGSSLAAAGLFRFYEKVQRTAEVALLEGVIDNVSWRSFCRQEPCTLTARAAFLDICGEKTLQFSRLDFGREESRVVFDAHGFPDKAALAAYGDGGWQTALSLERGPGAPALRGE